MASTTLSYDSESKCIMINKEQKLPISTFWLIGKKNAILLGNASDQEFVKQQTMMRMVDILKDGTTGTNALAVETIKGIMMHQDTFQDVIQNISGDWKKVI